MTGEVFYHKGPHSLLVRPGAEGVPQEVRTLLTLIDAGQLQVSSHYAINIGAA